MQSECSVQRDVVFILDVSGSMSEAYGMVVELARRAVDGLNVMPEDNIRVGVITFSDNATVEFYLDTYQTNFDVNQALYFSQSCTQLSFTIHYF